MASMFIFTLISLALIVAFWISIFAKDLYVRRAYKQPYVKQAAIPLFALTLTECLLIHAIYVIETGKFGGC